MIQKDFLLIRSPLERLSDVLGLVGSSRTTAEHIITDRRRLCSSPWICRVAVRISTTSWNFRVEGEHLTSYYGPGRCPAIVLVIEGGMGSWDFDVQELK